MHSLPTSHPISIDGLGRRFDKLRGRLSSQDLRRLEGLMLRLKLGASPQAVADLSRVLGELENRP